MEAFFKSLFLHYFSHVTKLVELIMLAPLLLSLDDIGVMIERVSFD